MVISPVYAIAKEMADVQVAQATDEYNRPKTHARPQERECRCCRKGLTLQDKNDEKMMKQTFLELLNRQCRQTDDMVGHGVNEMFFRFWIP
ncbi:MAG: hypothetical protein SPJ25_07170 [Prevotella sp.]|nr:hypothetical protein [Prevotella sp.]